MASTLDRLLGGDILDTKSGRPLQVSTCRILIEPNLRGREADGLQDLDLGSRLAVVCDKATAEALGDRVAEALASIAQISKLCYASPPHADDETARQLAAETASCDGLVAVGSGTINDLCKFVAAEAGKPYVVFPTAPSMNGYVSANAAITVAGHKKSLAAAAPVAVFVDLEVMSAAPPRLIRAGLGDSICRPTAQADWLLSHFLLETPYDDLPFRLLAEDEAGLLAESGGLLCGDPAVMARLTRTLLLSGFGMTLAGGSYPASQGEHLISHFIDMMGPSDLAASYHGEQIAVTTLTMARLQQAMLQGAAPRLKATAARLADFEARYGSALGSSCWQAFRPKALTAERAEALSARLADLWPRLVEAIQAISLPVATLEQSLAAIDAPRQPADLGWPESLYAQATQHAREIRDRYTFLDLAGDAGRLDLL